MEAALVLSLMPNKTPLVEGLRWGGGGGPFGCRLRVFKPGLYRSFYWNEPSQAVTRDDYLII